MATYSTGITASWNGTTFSEMQALSWTYGGGQSKGRSVAWSDELGTVSIQCLGSAGISTGNFAQRGTLTITGGGMTLTVPAIYQSCAADAQLNGVTRYTISLKVID